MRHVEKLAQLERYKALPKLTADEALVAIHPKTDQQEQEITERIWAIAAAVKQEFFREAKRSCYTVPQVGPAWEGDREEVI